MQQCITDRINHADSGNYSVSPTAWLSLSLSLFSLLLILSTYGARGFLITSIEIKGHAGSQFLPGI